MSYGGNAAVFRDACYKRLVGWQFVDGEQAGTLADLATAHACQESTNFTSNVFVQNNNAIGYGVTSSRWQVGSGTSRPAGEGGAPYAKYNSVGDCACEMADYIWRHRSTLADAETVTDFATGLKTLQYFTGPLSDKINGMETYYEVTPGVIGDGTIAAENATGSPAAVASPPPVVNRVVGWTLSSGAIVVILLVAVVWWGVHRDNGWWPFRGHRRPAYG